MNPDGSPIVENPDDVTPPAGGDNPNPGGEETPPAGDTAPHIQPGQSPTDLDIESILDEAEKEAADAEAAQKAQEEADAKKAEEEANIAAGKNPDGSEKEVEETPEEKVAREAKEAEEAQKAEAAKALDVELDISDPDNQFNVAEDARYGIKPITPEALRDPQQGESAADYFKAVTLPAIIQTQQNIRGIAARNADIRNGALEAEHNAELAKWEEEIKALATNGLIPNFTLDEKGSIPVDSEAGKVIGETWKLINDHNAKHPENRISSFDHGFRSLYQPKAEADAKAAAAKEADEKRRQGNAVLNGGGNNKTAPKSGPQLVRRGQSITDIDFEKALG